MKKTVSQVYRIIFIILSIWTLIFTVDFSHMAASADIAVISDTLNLAVISAVFLLSLGGSVADIILRIKSAFALLAALVLILNSASIFSAVSLIWILKVLLPAMAALDWLIFDKKGSFRPYDILLWALAALGLMSLLNKFFGISLPDISKLLLPALFLGAGMYLLDKLLSGKGIKNLLPMLLRLLFLALEAYAFYLLTSFNVESFVKTLKYLSPLSNLLAFALVLLIVIIDLLSKKKAAITAMKGCITAFLLFSAVFSHFLLKGSGAVFMLHTYICPALMLAEWIFFTRGEVKWHMPFLWMMLPVFYGIYTYLLLPSLYGSGIYYIQYSTFHIFASAIILSLLIGFALVLMNIVAKKAKK